MSMTYATAINRQTPRTDASTEKTAGNFAKTSGSTDSFKNHVLESVVDKYKRKHPDHAHHVDQQLRAGRAVRDKNSANISTENMTMAEYQAWFYALLDTIPYDPTRVNDTTTISISDKGWEQMR